MQGRGSASGSLARSRAKGGAEVRRLRMPRASARIDARWGGQRIGRAAGGRVARGLSKKKPTLLVALKMLAEWTGLEPATPGVTGRYSNQLNYHSIGRMTFQIALQVPPDLASPRGFEPL